MSKRLVPAFITVIFATFLLYSCKKKQDVSFDINNLPSQIELTKVPVRKVNSVDINLAAMSTEQVYAEIFNMLIEPENYEGKIIKAKGNFSVFTNETNGEKYFAILIKDKTECCQEDIQFVWPDHSFPEDYPPEGTEITITGSFVLKEFDGGITYTYLVLTSLETE